MEPDVSMDESYDAFPRIEEAFQQRLDESLDPSGPSSLLDTLEAVLAGRTVRQAVDVGCGEGGDAVELAQRFDVDVIAIDPVERHVELGRELAAQNGCSDSVAFADGRAEHLGIGDAKVDLYFAKESLMYVDLTAACVEAARVLRPGGVGFVYQVFTGEHMSDAEADRFWPMNAGARSLRVDDLERSIEAAGLAVVERIDIGSQWGEYGHEQSGTPGRRLAHVARLRRDRERYIAEFGRAAYDIMLHDCLWHVYRMLGFLHAAVVVFEKPVR